MDSELHPSGDERYLALDRTMKQFNYEKDALLEVLNTAQEAFGFLSEDLLIYVSSQLSVPLSRVYGVATFYHMFTFSPLGEHNCIICTGTACHVKGSNRIVQALSDAFNIGAGDTTPDGLFSLTTDTNVAYFAAQVRPAFRLAPAQHEMPWNRQLPPVNVTRMKRK
jgi:bidirectional [NiFe] hydrogenase diaphorase subunit